MLQSFYLVPFLYFIVSYNQSIAISMHIDGVMLLIISEKLITTYQLSFRITIET